MSNKQAIRKQLLLSGYFREMNDELDIDNPQEIIQMSIEYQTLSLICE